MASEITISQQSLVITEVGDVVVTPIQQDLVEGDWVRDIRVFAVPIGIEAQGTLLVQLRIRSASHDALNVMSPASEF